MQWKRFSQTALAGILGLALMVGLNVLASKQNWRWDSTATKRYSLAPETEDALESLKQDVVAVAFYRPEERAQIQDTLRLFSQKTPRFTYEFVDPDRSPFRAKEYEVAQTGTVVLLSGEKQEKLLFPDEVKLINGLIRVSNPRRAKLYFIVGHGEASPEAMGDAACTMLASTLREQGVDTQTLTLARQEAVPADADALLILGPKKDLLEHELEVLSDYWSEGGRLFIALAAESKTNLDAWLENANLQRLDGFAIDPVSKLIVGDPMAPLVQDYGFHPITQDFNLMTIFPTAAALQAIGAKAGQGDAQAAIQPEYLGRSTEQSWLETDIQALRQTGTAEFNPQSDVGGPLWLAAVFEQPLGSTDNDSGEAADTTSGEPAGETAKNQNSRARRAVVFADQDFVTDQYVNLSGNMDLARNASNWLLEREELITVSKPEAANVFLTLSVGERMIVSWTPLLLLPGLCLVVAIMMGLKRRKAK